ncbi:hypothetical protein Tco_0720940 [Tanacetum coccineum]
MRPIWGLLQIGIKKPRYVVPTGRVKVPAGRYIVPTDRVKVPTGRVKVPAGRYVVPTGKDNVIVSAGRSKVIPAVTYTSVHSEARSWSIPSEDPYEEAARQLLEQAPLPAKDEAPTPLLPPSFLSPRIQPTRTRAAMAHMRATALSTYHTLLPSGTPPLLPIPLPAPSTSRRADILEANTPPRKRRLLTTPRPGCEVGESSAAAAR